MAIRCEHMKTTKTMIRLLCNTNEHKTIRIERTDEQAEKRIWRLTHTHAHQFTSTLI